MVKIISIKWMSEEALEAEVVITDGIFQMNCFSQPLRYVKGDMINENLYGFDVSNVKIANEPIEYINKIGNNFEYQLSGRLVNKKNKVIGLGEILIEVKDLPYDINEGEYVEFNCKRIDIY